MKKLLLFFVLVYSQFGFALSEPPIEPMLIPSAPVFLIPNAVSSHELEHGFYAHVVSVYDGDTFKVNIDELPLIFGHRLNIRIRGIDTPEIRGQCDKERRLAYEARNRLVLLLRLSKQVYLTDLSRDKYFRLVATVFVDHINVAKVLLREHLAVKYFGNKKHKNWCD